MAKRGRPKKEEEPTKRGQSKHPGVAIVKRGSRFYARWDDPVLSKLVPVLDELGEPLMDERTGRPRMRLKRVRVEQCLDTIGKTTEKAREIWCKAKANDLRDKRARIAAGEAVIEKTTVTKALEGYYKAKKSELQPETLKAYAQGTKPFETWCSKNTVVFIQDLTAPELARYRTWFIAIRAHEPLTGNGVGKGKRREGKRKKSPSQQNKQLNSLRVVLSQLRREGKLPLLDSDAIKDSLRFVKRERAKRKYLDTAQIKALLEAAQRHDRDGHDPIAPFIAACLATGMRFHELCDLDFEEVDIEAGRIHLAAQRTKTSTERYVYLDKLPTLLDWLTRTKLAAGGKGRVFPHLTFAIARMARARLMDTGEKGYSAPPFTFHRLRATCGTYSVCASLYGRGSEHETAQQLGHSIQVAQAHYTGRAKDFEPNAQSLEAAMKCPAAFRACFQISLAATSGRTG